MRGFFRWGTAFPVLWLVGLAVVSGAGCHTTTKSGLPDHIRTVEVHIFENKTMYYGIEGVLTRGIIDRINADTRVKVAGRNGDALLTGEITKVTRDTLRETTTNEPGTVQIVLEVTFSFYDQINGRYLIEDAVIKSTDTGTAYGFYEASRGENYDQGARGAAAAAAAEIVRRTVGMW